MEIEVFSWVEYIAFAMTMLVSVAIGVYFGAKGDQNTFFGYLHGSKQMSLIPISLSLVTAFISGIGIMGLATESYTNGTQWQAGTMAFFLVALFTAYMVIPVFYKLQLISSYEYMELRFGRGVRLVTSVLFTINQLLYIPVVILGAAMALNQVTGIDELWINLFISSVCIFYTALGGLRAVVWTDTIQGVLMVVSVLVLLVAGTLRVGGVERVFSAASESGRLEFFNLDLDPTVRITFWSSFFGANLLKITHMAFSPESLQRYTSLPTLSQAQISTFLLAFGLFFFTTTATLNGLVAYAEYEKCDPLSSGMINRPDQLLLYFVVQISRDIQGCGGLFLAGLVSAALSSMSAGLNTLAGTFYKDLVSPIFKTKPSEAKAVLMVKGLVVILGAISILNVMMFKGSANLAMLLAVLCGLTDGPVAGLFILGLLFPWVTSKGAVWGGLTSMVCMTWLTVANSLYKSAGHLMYPTKVTSVEGCLHNFTKAVATVGPSDDSDMPYVYRITVFYNVMIGMFVCVVTGLVVSYLTGFNKLEDVNPDLISPVVRGFLPERTEQYAPVPLVVISEVTNDVASHINEKEE